MSRAKKDELRGKAAADAAIERSKKSMPKTKLKPPQKGGKPKRIGEGKLTHSEYSIEKGHGGMKRNRDVAYTQQAGESEDTSEQTMGGKWLEKIFDAGVQYYSSKALGEGIGDALDVDDED